jgi:nicotinate dehydrogenase subunit B
MNAHQNDLNFSRRDLLKGGGAMIIGFSMAGLPAGAALSARGDVAGPFDMGAIDTWIAIHSDNTATVYIGKGEFGQGNTTGLLQIAAEELDLDMSQVRSVQLDTNVVTNQGATTSSSSIERGGPQIRAAAAEARRALLNLASTRLGMQVGSLVVNKGIVSIDGHPTQSVSYGVLLGDKPFNVKFTGTAPQKAITRYKLVGTNVPRIDSRQGGRQVHAHAARPRARHAARPGCPAARTARLRRRRQARGNRREVTRRYPGAYRAKG